MAVFVNLPLYTTSVDFTSHNQNLIELQTLVQGNKSIQLLTVYRHICICTPTFSKANQEFHGQACTLIIPWHIKQVKHLEVFQVFSGIFSMGSKEMLVQVKKPIIRLKPKINLSER